MEAETISESLGSLVHCPVCGLELHAGVQVCPNDGTKVSAEPEIGQIFQNKYECVERIASGGMGVVYKARQQGLNRTVALKVLQSTNVTDISVRRFNQEAQALGALDHPNLVRVYEAGVTAFGHPYTVMEFIDGVTLETVTNERRLTLGKALNIFIQICDGLAYVHARGILHRDLKPSNIMLTDQASDNPRVKLLDFGIAKVIDQTGAKSLTQTGDVFGSPNFMSPEQAKGIDMDQRSDLYSLGCLMYDVLTGSPPFCANTAVSVILKQVSEKPKPLNSAMGRQKYPNALEAIVGKLLEKEPVDRYQSVEELKNELTQLSKWQRSWYQLKLPSRQAAARGRTGFYIAAAGALLVLSLSVFVFWTLFSDKPDESKVSLLDENRVVDEVVSTADTKFKAGGNNDLNLSNIAVLRQNDQGDSDDKLDLRGANPLSFVHIKERPDKYVTELRAYRIDDKAMPNIAQLPLFKLEMRDAPATDASLKYITGIHTLAQLELSGMHLNVEDCEKLLQLRRLNDLALNNCGLDNACIKVLSQSKFLTNLQISQNIGITGAAVQSLAEAQLPLTVLNLSGTSLGDRAAPYLAKLNDVQELELSNTNISDAALPELAKMTSLRWLDLSQTKITSDGLAKFRPLNLLRLRIADCQVSGLAVNQFKRSNPNCAVYRKVPAKEHVKMSDLQP